MGRFLSQIPTAEEDLEPWEAENVLQDFKSDFAFNQEEYVANVAAAIGPKTKTAETNGPRSEWTLLSIHARHQQKAIKFQVHFKFPLKMMDLEKGLAQVLNLKLGTFQIKYLDTENDWILMACDDDMQDLLVVSRSSCESCDGTVEMIVKEKPLL